MIVLWLALGFAAVCALLWLLMFPESGERVAAWMGRLLRRGGDRARRGGRRVAGGVGGTGRSVRAVGAGALGALSRHRLVLGVAIALLCVPPLLILALRQRVVLEGFSSQDLSQSRTAIAELLRGERLVPPPPPPPAVFTTAEVRRVKPEIVTADRKWDRLSPDLQQRVLAIYRVMRDQYGIEMVLVEGYRSPERQAELMRGGRATNAGAWSSCHQYGLALDSAPMRRGKLQWDMGDAWTRRAYFLYGELAVQAGLVWGGNWRSLKDYVHVEMGEECTRAKRARRRQDAPGR
ncbi:M15 family metallopeptidase [Luteimonas sp. RD2P54]|uniref:M15 family metallopeptidase n=1 Tax=Luteimonas endophytica TaxID=3042023 RepID=A0ABT6JA86_9GAMM|nr:M15 family metallopeptidase [Luteimonas endophytica]MDH5823741.1 M15 family metallopeptidase [Luteimonas endophytica]